MRNRIAVLLCALVLITGVPLALSAQITSPTARISSDMFMTDADNAFGFLNVVNFSALDGKSIFAGDFSSSTYLDIGYATKLGGIYLGVAYAGNIYKDATYANNSYSTTNQIGGNGSVLGTIQNSYTQPYTNTANDNDLNILLGFGKIGIQASIGETVSTNKKNYKYVPSLGLGTTSLPWAGASTSITTGDSSTVYNASGTVATTTTVTPFTSGSTNYAPAITAGMSLNAGDLVIKPMLRIAAGFYSQNYGSKWLTYDASAGSGLPSYQSIANVSNYTSVDYTNKLGYTSLNGMIGSRLEKGAWAFDLYYNFSTNLYSNSYLDSDGTTTKTASGTVSSLAYTTYSAGLGVNTTATTYGNQVNPVTHVQHYISGLVQYTLPIADKLKVAMSFKPSFTLNNDSSSSNGSQVTTTAVVNSNTPTSSSTQIETITTTGQGTTTSEIDFSPVIAGALKYGIVDKVLDFNLGATVNLANLSSITTTSTTSGYSSDKIVYEDYTGTVTSTNYTSTLGASRSDSSNTQFSLNSVTMRLNWGLTWNLLDNVTLDTYFTNTSGTTLDITQFTVMLSIKK